MTDYSGLWIFTGAVVGGVFVFLVARSRQIRQSVEMESLKSLISILERQIEMGAFERSGLSRRLEEEREKRVSLEYQLGESFGEGRGIREERKKLANP